MSLPRSVIHAPDFPPGLAWINTSGPVSLADLRGRFVLIDFWTSCCINCLHVLPDLKRLEAAWPEALAVIGVHSAKFENERELEQVRQAVLRHEIAHPVVSDPDYAVWERWGAKAWPSFFLVDPRGYLIAQKSGEGIFEPIHRLLADLVPRYEAEGLLRRQPLPLSPEPPRQSPTMLRFPGKVSADAHGERLFLSDTHHHRLLVLDPEGGVLLQIGSGEEGFSDGSLTAARFRRPQGSAYDPASDRLFVADTGNHALRAVDLTRGTVETLAGTGRQSGLGATEARGSRDPLSSPWDVLLHDGVLYVAMAGTHQVWAFDPEMGHGAVWAGTGEEHLVDGPRRDALLAQPGGLATDGAFLYIADSETSSVRRVPLAEPDANVETLIGEGLFAFGDVDGARPEARLQHPLGLAYAGGALFVADSYNHRIKRLDLESGRVAAWSGSGHPGLSDGSPDEARYQEPGGCCVLGGTLFVADTNNHALRAANLVTGAVRTVPVAFTPPPPAFSTHAPLRLAPGAGEVVVEAVLPEGHTANPQDPGALRLTSADEGLARTDSNASQPAAPCVRFPLTLRDGATELTLTGSLLTCDVATGTCYRHAVRLRLPLVIESEAPDEATVRLAVALRQ